MMHVLLVGLCSVLQAQEGRPKIEVFLSTDQAVIKPHAYDITLYALDAPDKIEATFPQFKGRNAQQDAKRWAQKNGHRIAYTMRDAAQGRIKAIEYAVLKVPAIVFDGKYVVYGTTDVGRALRVYQHDVAQTGAQ